MEITYIYELSKNGIPFYIGKTKDLKDRENKHKKKHGNDIIMTEIDSVNSFDKKYWKPLETFWITQYKSFGFELINKNEGGGGQGGWRTQEDKKRYMKEYDKRKNNELKKENKCRGSYTPTQQLQQALQQVEANQLQTPTVSTSNGTIDYFGYQLAVHHFNLKIMSRGMQCRGIKLKDLKAYYGLKGRTAADCLPQFEAIMEAYKARSQNN